MNEGAKQGGFASLVAAVRARISKIIDPLQREIAARQIVEHEHRARKIHWIKETAMNKRMRRRRVQREMQKRSRRINWGLLS